MVESMPGSNSVSVDERCEGSSATDQLMVTRVGLAISGKLTFENWQRAGSKLARVHDSSVWCLGDWVAYGEKEYEDRYVRAIDAVGLEYQTLRNYAWVARRFGLSRRRDTLSFQHHAVVASLPPEEQDRWLDLAEQNQWSRNRMRQHLRAGKGDLDAALDAVAMPQFQVDRTTMQRWRSAAEQSSRKFEEWVVECLDFAARDVLPAQAEEAADGAEPDVVEPVPPTPRTGLETVSVRRGRQRDVVAAGANGYSG
jgi:hypothetical protein